MVLSASRRDHLPPSCLKNPPAWHGPGGSVATGSLHTDEPQWLPIPGLVCALYSKQWGPRPGRVGSLTHNSSEPHLHCTHFMPLPTFCTIAPQMMSPGPGPLDRSRASQYLSRQDQSEVASWPERRSMSHLWEGHGMGPHPLLPGKRGLRFAPSLRGELQKPQSCKAARAGGPGCQVG